MKDLGDKLEASDKSKLEEEINNVKEALKGSDSDRIRKANDKLTEAFNEVSQKIYSQNPGAQPGAGPEEGPGAADEGDDVYDADYEVVDDEN